MSKENKATQLEVTPPEQVQVIAGVTATTPLYSKRVRNMFNPPEPTLEMNNQPSVTIPDQALSLKEILDRFSKGIPPPQLQGAGYLGEDSLLEGRAIETLDLTERAALKQMLQTAIKRAQDIQAQQLEKAKEEEYLQKLKAKETTQKPATEG